MNSPSTRNHREKAYATKGKHEVSWFQESPAISLALIDATGLTKSAAIAARPAASYSAFSSAGFGAPD